MRLFYTDEFVLPLPDGHTFPMTKYRLLRDHVQASGMVAPDALVVPRLATRDELLRAHDADYIDRATAGQLTDAAMKRIGFPWSPQLIERSRRSSGATIEACEIAIQSGCAVNLAGGTHHAFRDHGEGYCVFNDAVVAAHAMQATKNLRRIAIVDLDVHQGNGTAALCQNDPSIYTFSMHGERNYPIRKERSDLDIALPDRTPDEPYLEALARSLRQTLEDGQPELVIYLAGSDPYEHDRLGRLALTKAGLAERDARVFAWCRQAGLPIVVTMAGGYAKSVEDTADIHWQTVRQAIAFGVQ